MQLCDRSIENSKADFQFHETLYEVHKGCYINSVQFTNRHERLTDNAE